MLDPYLKETLPAPVRGTFEGERAAAGTLGEAVPPAGSTVSTVEVVALLLACSGFCLFHKHDPHWSGVTLNAVALQVVGLMR